MGSEDKDELVWMHIKIPEKKFHFASLYQEHVASVQ